MSDDRDLETREPEQASSDSVCRPGPHGAAGHPMAEEEIARAHRRAERTVRRSFQEVRPRFVTAAEAVTSISDEDEDLAQAVKRSSAKSRACFIATAAYGDANCADVEQLRGFRDRRLLTNPVGSVFVRAYYRVSPPFARLIARNPRLRTTVRKVLTVFQARAAL